MLFLAAALIVIAGAVFLLRQHIFSQWRVIADAPLKVWRDAGASPADQPLAMVPRGQSLPVTDCVYGKDTLNYRVRLPDGRSGYVIAPEGFHVNGPGGRLPDYPQDFCF